MRPVRGHLGRYRARPGADLTLPMGQRSRAAPSITPGQTGNRAAKGAGGETGIS